LRAGHLPDTSVVTNSLTHFQSGQLSNGSWANDPYTTALQGSAELTSKMTEYYDSNTSSWRCAMGATTLKLSDRLRSRLAKVIVGTDQSAHAFMIEAIEKQTTLAELRKKFVAEALASEKAMLRSGKGYSATEVHRYMAVRAAGKKISRPKAKSWR
jgi:predicted transcriptional regulator